MKYVWLTIFVCWLWFIWMIWQTHRARVFFGKVIYVTDGDTLTVMHGGSPVCIRLWGIDAPEMTQPYGEDAWQYAMDIALGRRVKVFVMGERSYGRTVASVRLPGRRDLGTEMVREGLAWWSPAHAPTALHLEYLQQEAHDARRGLWAAPRPLPPWVWRRMKERTSNGHR